MPQSRIRIAIAAAFVSLIAAGSVAAQKISEDQLRDDVKYLASDALEGRRAATPANLKAAGFLAERFRAVGLRNAPGLQNYFHRFSYTTGVELGDRTQLLLLNANGVRPLQLGTEYNPMGFSSVGSVQGDLVFVGYGITNPEAKYDDYAGVNVNGKIAVAMRYGPDGNNPHSSFAEHMSFMAKVRAARSHGATALIVINQPNEEKKLYPLMLERAGSNFGLPVLFATSPAFDDVRDPQEQPLKEVQLQIDSLKRPNSFPISGWRADLNVDLRVNRDSIPNVIGVLPGTDPKLKDEVVVIGGHFDHLGWGGEGSLAHNHDSAIHHGADDNASGTAAVLALAEYFAKKGGNRRTLVFCGFNAEEEGLLGSAALVANFPYPIQNVVAMVNMDMIGRLDSNTLVMHGIGTSPEWEPMVKRLNRNRFTLKLVPDGFGPSDHSSFYAKDIPVLFYFTNLHKDYHRPSDTWEKVNYPGLKQIVELVAENVSAVDGMDQRPAFTTAQATQTPRSGSGFKVYVGTIPDYAFEGKGLRLSGVSDGGPAATAGLKGGDVIVKLGGKEIANIYDYTDALGQFKPKQEVEVEYLRGSATVTGKIVMGSR
ncbi:MAG: PDZ domain-containing protein [Chlorobi bacterium CHB2]|nr:PDZ domain-containing protein [Chlorobi bacterium CHB2]